jgi:tetratricopeptide (TPR) repeat protein
MGIVPVLDPSKIQAVAAGDQIAGLLSQNSRITVLTADQLIQAANRDSIDSESYWIRYGERLGLHALILTRVLHDSLCVRCMDYKTDRDLMAQGHSPEADSLILLFLNRLNMISSDKPIGIPPVSQQKYWRARVYQLLGHWNLAFDLYDSIEEPLPEVLFRKVEIMIKLGEREQQAGRMSSFYFEAENLLDLLEKDNAFQAVTLKLRFNLSVVQGSWNRSEALIKKVFSLNPNEASLYFLAARLHPSRFRALGFKNREQLYKRAIALNPAFVKAYLALGDLYYFRQNMEKSETVYRDLLRINPESVDALLALGKIYLYRGETVQLIETYERLLKNRPENPEVIYNLGIAYYNQNLYDRAIQLFQMAGDQYRVSDAFYYLGVIFMKLNRTEEAVESFRRRIDLRHGQDDFYANEAVKFLYQLLQAEAPRVDNDAIH